jgi:FAD/FMN-containing dehydrogenase
VAAQQLFIGAEGTLGVVTVAVLKLFAPPRSSALALLKLQSVEQALQIMQRLRGVVGDRLGSLEIMSRSQIEAIAATVPHVAIPFELATPWYLIVELSHDSVVPLERQAAFVSNVETRIMAGLPHARVVMHGHIGDGNIHVVALDIDLMRGVKQLLDPNGLMNPDKIFAAERRIIGSAGAV